MRQEIDDGVLGCMYRHQLDHVQTICTSLQTDNHTSTPSLNFYRPDALPDHATNIVEALKTNFKPSACFAYGIILLLL